MVEKNMVEKERYKSYRAAPIVIKFPVDIDDEEYDRLREYLYDIFPVSIIEKPSPKIVIVIVPEGMVPAAEEIKKSFAGTDVVVDSYNYDIYIIKSK